MTTPDAVVAMITATNAGDNGAFLDSFTPDAYLEDWGRGFTGRDEIARWNQTDNIGRQAHFEALKTTALKTTAPKTKENGDEFVVTLRVTGNGYNGESDISFVLTPDRQKIARLIISAD